MKRIGILTVLILCLVVGGVYATWDYSQGSATEQKSVIAVNITQAETKGSKGNIGAQGASSLNIYIDDTDKNLKADTVTCSGSLTITFEPDTNADAEVISKGIIIEYILEPSFTLAEYTFDGQQVFLNVDSTPQVLNSGQPTKSTTLNGADIAKLITINPELSLPTKVKYDDFYDTLGSHGFKITIREKAKS